jgi:hypothetical protein
MSARSSSANPRTQPARRVFLLLPQNELHAVTSGDGRWKLYFPHSYRSLAGKTGRNDGSPVEYEMKRTRTPELYDLKNDISETTNVADQHPEVIEKLLQSAARIRADLGDSLTKTPATGTRPPGRVGNEFRRWSRFLFKHVVFGSIIPLWEPASGFCNVHPSQCVSLAMELTAGLARSAVLPQIANETPR